MLQKQNIEINFAQGLDTKTDAKQVQVGKFLALQNTIFTKGGLLQKRNGFGSLTSLPNNDSTYLTTFNGNLTAISGSINSYSESNNQWFTKGTIQPLSLNVLPLIRSNTNQSQADIAIASNGFICTVYTDQNPSNLSQSVYKYVVADSTTGSNIIEPTLIPTGGTGTLVGAPRVFYLGNWFIILYTNDVSGTYHLQYIAVNVSSPEITTLPQDIASSYIPAPTLSYDAVVAPGTSGNSLYIAYNTTSGGQSIQLKYLTSTLTLSTGVTFSGRKATAMSMTSDITNPSSPVIYASFYDSSSSTGYTLAVNNMLATLLAPVEIISATTVLNITCAAQNGVCTTYYEVSNDYSYDSTIATNYINSVSVPLSTGTPSSTITVVRSVGLASKAFISEGVEYFLSSWESPLQSTYFLINGTLSTEISPIIVGKLAYENGGGYLLTGLPNVTVNGNIAQIPYLYKDLIQAVNKGTNLPVGTQIDGIYSQTGINYATFTFGTQNFDTVEIGGSLQMSGGFFWMFDGYLPVEQNFFLFPEDIETIPTATGGALAAQQYYYQATYEWTDNQGMPHRSAASVPVLCDLSRAALSVTFNGVFSNASSTITVNSIIGLYVGQELTDNTTSGNILPDTFITSINPNTNVIHISQPTAGASASTPGDSLTADVNPLGVAASFTQGENQILVASAAGFLIGQYLTDLTTPANLQANTYITDINYTTNVITLNQPVTATATADTLNTTSQCSAVINIPTLRLTYKTANPVKLVVYRWSVAQQEYYQVTSIEMPLLNNLSVDSISFTDTLSDTQILGNNLIYTTGGVVEDVNAPASNIMTLWNTRVLLVDAEDPNLIWYSKQVIENTPVEMSDLFTIYVAPTIGASGSTGPITALGAMDDKLVIFKKDAIYYINGTGPDNTGANNQFSDPIFITSVVGCADQQSIVFTPAGLMFQSDKGIWLLGRGLDTSYIGAPVEDFTLSANVLSSVIVPQTNQVRFTLNSGLTLMYDYFYEQWGTFVNVPGISSCIYNGLHTYLNSFGAVFQETPDEYLDGTDPVLISFTTSWLKLAGLQGYQTAHFFYVLGEYISPHLLQVSVAYDYNIAPIQASLIKPINYGGPLGTGPQNSPLGQQSPLGGPGSLEQWRVFLKKQRCQSFQVTIQEVFDASFGVPAGEGLTISGLNMIASFKSKFRTIGANTSIGGGSV